MSTILQEKNRQIISDTHSLPSLPPHLSAKLLFYKCALALYITCQAENYRLSGNNVDCYFDNLNL